jgi:hydroxymethylpyrimidine/phosphomethylpyrimidine kinase
VLTIAGSDSGGGAGIQADLKAFARCGVHGMSAITAITAQNTLAITGVHQVPPEMVLAQVRAVVSDIGVDAVKVGMLGSAEVALAVAQALDELPSGTPIVVDPVMVAESGARLLAGDAQEALMREILPRASVLTPNVPEARVLAGERLQPGAGDDVGVESRAGADSAGADSAGRSSAGDGSAGEGSAREGSAGEGSAGEALADEDAEMEALARSVLALGPRVVVLTGGHRAQAADLFLDSSGGSVVLIDGERYPDGAAHGSGCTHSSLLAAQLALGHTPLEAARRARELAGQAVAHGLRDIGAGAGPVDVIGLAALRGS